MAQYIGNSLDTVFLKTKRQAYTYLATAGQTIFSGADSYGNTFASIERGQVLVYENGVLLEPQSYTVYADRVEYNSGGAALGAEVVVFTEVESALVNSYTRAETEAAISDAVLSGVSNVALDDLTDVDLTTAPTDGQALIWDNASGQFIPGDSFSQTDFDSAFAAKSADDLTEGSTNLYYTDARVGAYLEAYSFADESYVDTALSNLIDTAPTTLDTLNELAAALGDDPNFATTITTSIGTKLATADFNSTADTWLGTTTTDELSEGSTNLYYTSARVIIDVDNILPTKTTTDLAEGTNFYYTDARVDSNFALKTTDQLTEGSTNLYFTAARVNDYLTTNAYTTETYVNDAISAAASDFNSDFALKTTTDLAEGSNLYFTAARVSDYLTTNAYATETFVGTAISTAVGDLTTTDLVEGSNLYFTAARVDDYLTTNAYATETFVGTAISTASSNYATAAQGALADTALQAADLTGYATETFVGTAISNLVDSSPATLDTLNELAAALGDDPNFATTTATAIGLKANAADLGTAAAEDVAFFATAAQGALADSALQSVAFADLTTTPTTLAGYGITDAPSDLTDLGITDGTTGQILTTDGAGGFTFEDAAEPLVVSGTAPSSPEEGALWFDNVTTGQLYAYVGTSWLSTAGITTLEFSSVGDLSDVDLTTSAPTAGQALIWDAVNSKFIPGESFSQSDFDTAFTANSTDDLSEGATNLYYTDTRADARIALASSNYATAAQGALADSALQSVAFADLTSTPTTLAGYGITDAATSTQGALADSALQTADLNGYATETYVGTAISNLIDTAPTTLDTLNELAAALGDDPNFATSVTNSIGLKANTADLGTAAYEDVGYFATAAQGTLADSALQSVAFADLTTTPTTLAGYGITDAPSALTDLGITEGTTGQVLTTDGAGTYTFEDAASSVVVSGTAPATPSEGDMWFDNVTTGQLYTYVGSSWLSTAGITTLEFSSVGDLADVDITSVAPTDGQSLVWDNANSKFVPVTVSTDLTGYATETFVNTAISSVAFADLTTTPTTVAGYGITDAFDGAYGSLSGTPTIPSVITDLGIVDGTAGQVLTTNGSGVYTFSDTAVAYGDSDVATYLSSNDYATATSIIATITDSAPGTLDTLNELAAALGDDANFSTTVTNSIALKANSADLGTAAAQDVGYFATAAQGALADSALQSVAFADLGITDGTVGQVLTTDGAGVYTFEDAANPTTVSGTAPATPNEGDLWFDNVTTGQLYTYVGSSWLSTAGITTLEFSSVGDLSDVDITSAAPTAGQALVWDNANSKFVPGDVGADFSGYATETYVNTAISTASSNYATAAQGALADSALQSVAFSDLTSTPTTLAGYGITDAFDGAYGSLSGAPTLGTASAQDVGYFATAAQGALADSSIQSLAGYATETYVNTAVSNLVDAAPGTLDTLNELAAALGDDANFATTTANAIALKANSADLGTASAQDVGYFATAAQGALADSALQSVAFADLTTTPTTLVGYGITDAFDGAYASLTGAPSIPSVLTNLGITDGTVGQVLTTDGAGGFTFADASSGGSSVTVSATAPLAANEGDLWFDDTTTGQLYVYENSAWTSTGIPPSIGSIDELADVDTTTIAPVAGQSLVWDAVNSKFIPGDSFSQSDFNTALGTISTDIIPDTDVTYDLGSATNRFKDLYLSGNTLYLGEVTLSVAAGALVVTDALSNPVSITLSNNTTDDLAEGLTNLYYTDARADARIALAASDYATAAQGALADTALQAADLTGYATESYVGTQIANLVDTAPSTLDTLNELAAALGDDPNFATSTATAIGLKANTADLSAVATTGAYSDLTGIPSIPSALTDFGITDGTVGQVLTTDGAGGFTFADAGGASVVVSGTSPENAEEGDLWFDSVTTGELHVYESGIWLSTAVPAIIESINELGDVDISTTAPTDGQSLVWDNANSKFVPGTVSTDLTGYATETFVGTAISTASSNYATAAQGALADSALQSVAFSDLGIADGTVGQVLTTDGAGGFTFADASGGGGSSITTSETAPVSPTAGDMWFNSATLALYLYYADGDSTQWIQINDAGGAAGNGLVLISSTPPANPASGDLWYDDGSTGSLLIYNGSVWVSTADGGGGGGQSTYWVEASTTYDAVAGSKLFVDTSSSTVQVNLPASPVMGDEVYVVDAAGNSGTYNITVNRNGKKITGLDENFTIDVNGAAIILAYYNVTRGWIVISK